MEVKDLRKGMRFLPPNENVSVRNRDNFRWTAPEISITNIRRNHEDPDNTMVYYKDAGGNRYKTVACDFLERYGDFYKQGKIAVITGEDFLTAEELEEYAELKRRKEKEHPEKFGDEMKNKRANLENLSDFELARALETIDFNMIPNDENYVDIVGNLIKETIMRLKTQHSDGFIEEESCIETVSKKAQELPFTESDIADFFETDVEFGQFEKALEGLSPEEVALLDSLQLKQEKGLLSPLEEQELNVLLDKLDKAVTQIAKKAQELPPKFNEGVFPEDIIFQGMKFKTKPTSGFASSVALIPLEEEGKRLGNLWMKDTGEVFRGDEKLGLVGMVKRKSQFEELLETEDVEEESIDKNIPSKDDILDWFSENPNPNDEKVHAFAEEMGFEADVLEEVIYGIVTDHVQMLDELGEYEETE